MNDSSSTSSLIRAQLEDLSSLVALVSRDLTDDVTDLAHRCVDTLRRGGKLIFCGNGGSAADAQHLAAEYVVRFARARRALPAMALTTDTSVLTAAGNDFGFDTVFARQIEALARPGDLLLLHSTSGESDNLLAAADQARSMGVATVALLAKGGGRLRERVDFGLVVPTDVTARAQEIHLAIGHLVCDVVDRAFSEDA